MTSPRLASKKEDSICEMTNQLVFIYDFLLCGAVFWSAHGSILTADLFSQMGRTQTVQHKGSAWAAVWDSRQSHPAVHLGDVSVGRFTLEFAAQSRRAVRLCGVACVTLLEQDGSYIPSREHQRKKKKKKISCREMVKIAVNCQSPIWKQQHDVVLFKP